MNTLNILSGGAAQGLVKSLAPVFRTQTGFDIAGEFGAVGAMADKLRKGTPADIIILTATIVARLSEEQLVVPTSIKDVGLVDTSLAVRAGDPSIVAKDCCQPARCLSGIGCDLRSGHQVIDRGHSRGESPRANRYRQ